MQKADNQARACAIAAREWQQLIDTACRDLQPAPNRIARVEGVLQMALELDAVDATLLLHWGELAAQRLAAAVPNPLWPRSVIDVGADGEVRIAILHKRAPVYRSTSD